MSSKRRVMTRAGYSMAATMVVSLISSQVQAGGQQHASRWSSAVSVAELNSPAPDGCPIESEDGLSVFIASSRSGTFGANDIWAADRDSIDSPWGEVKNLGEPINTMWADFCPTPVMGRWLFFVSERLVDGSVPAPCGGGDMYLARQSPAGGWSTPEMLKCAPEGPNTEGGERSPSLVETWHGTYLFYSTNGNGANQDIYVSTLGPKGFGPGKKSAALSTPDFEDIMPNVRVRKDGSLEMVFSSNRPTWGGKQPAFGAQDVYVAYSWWPTKGWSTPKNLGKAVNTPGTEQRATLSRDGKRLYFGRDGDIFMSTRKGQH